MDCVGEAWTWRAAVDCVGKGGFGARLWIVSTRVGLGACLWIVSTRVGLGRGCGLHRRGWLGARLDCADEGWIGARRYRNCVKRRCGKKVRKVANL